MLNKHALDPSQVSHPALPDGAVSHESNTLVPGSNDSPGAQTAQVRTVDFGSMPRTMRDLPIDSRGYPVPWFVAWVDGKPEFRAADAVKFRRAIRDKLCWVCGGRMGVHVAFVAGPMCGINRTSGEPPNHLDCARWSALNCPFLSNPRMVRREDELVNNAKLREDAAGMALARNPGVALIWITRQFEVFRAYNGFLIQMGEPESVEWYASGRPATRAEVQASIESGLPNLEAIAKTEPGGLQALQQAIERFQKWMPEANE